MKPEPTPERLHNILAVGDTIENLRLARPARARDRWARVHLGPQGRGHRVVGDGRGLGVRYRHEASQTRVIDASEDEDLSTPLEGVRSELRTRLRTAAVEARAPYLEKLADEVAFHSVAAAERLRALAARFDYDVLLEALPVE